jgi:two-component system, NtrC family, sensor kinase
MRRHSRAGGKSPNAQAPKAVARKSRIAPKAGRPRSTNANLETEVARLTRERDEALQQQRATADVLKVISRSALDLRAVFDAVVESSARLCAAERAFFFRLDGGLLRATATHNVSAEVNEWFERNPIRVDDKSITGRSALKRRTINVTDALANPDYKHPAKAIETYRSFLAVPVLKGTDLLGVISLYHPEVKPFTDRQVAVVETFAHQAAIAIENARLFEAEQQRTQELTESLEQQTATSEVLQVISSSPGQLRPVFDAILDNAVRICESQNATLWLQQDGKLRRAARYKEVPDAIVPSQPSANSTLVRAVRTKQIIHIPDYRTDQAFLNRDQFAVAAADQLGIRTNLCVPMLKEGEAVGAISIYRTEVRPFTEKQIELIARFADQAVIAIENARLLNELRQRTTELTERTTDLTEALEQQTATSEVLEVISSTPGDLEPVFATMLEKAVRICDASFGNIYRWDGEVLHLLAAHDTPAALVEVRRRSALRPTALYSHVVATRTVAHVADLAASEDYVERHPAAVAAVELGGVRTALLVPLVKEDELIGSFTIYRREVRPFTDKQIALVTNFAAQAVIAIENARLLNELRQRTTDLTESLEQQTATSNVLQIISSSPGELEPVFAAMLASAAHICEAKFGNLFLREGEAFRAVAWHGEATYVDKWKSDALIIRTDGPDIPLARLAATKQRVHIADLRHEAAYEAGFAQLVALIDKGGARTLLIVPMLKEHTLVGAIALYRQDVRPFTDKQITLVENFAAQAVIAIENARLLNELRQRTDDLTESLEQQTATSKVLDVISRSAFDLNAVFEAVAESSVKLCGADRGFIFRFDGELLRLVATVNATEEFRDWVERNPIRPGRHTGTARAALERRTIHIPDVLADPEYTYGAKDVEAIRTILGVPMLKGNDLLGVIMIYRLEVKPFTDKQIALVETFADQAAIAIENVRLLDELRERTNELGQSVGELRALGEVSHAVNSTLELETVLSTIVANAVQLSGTKAGAIYVYDDRQREFHLRATYGMEQELIDALTHQRIGLDEPNITPAFREGEPIQVPDLREAVSSAANDIVLRAGFRALLIAPLLRGEDIVGMLVVRRRTPGTFPQNTIDLIKTFAAQSAVAIENARLFQSVQTSLEDLRTTQDRLVQTQKLASLGQLTAGIAHEIKNPLNFVNNFSGVSVELIDELRETFEGIEAPPEARAAIAELTDTLRDNLNKIAQHGKRADSIVKNMLLHSREGSGEHRPIDINALVEEAVNLAYHGARAEKQGFNITLERSIDPTAGQVDCFPQEITRVLLNLISNGFYAATKRQQTNDDDYEPALTAATRNLGDRVEIRIRDNGTGISPEVREKLFNPFFTTKPAGEGTGLGLSLSHDIIVKQHGGSIEVDSQPGEYTEVRIVLPRTAAFPQQNREGQT